MAGSLTFDERLGVVRAEVTGDADPAQFESLFLDLVSGGRYPPDSDCIWDLRGLRFSDVTVEFLKTLTDIFEPHDHKRGEANVAIVVSGDQDVAMSKVFKAVSDRKFAQTLEIFTDMEAAERWMAESRRAAL